MGVLSTEIQEKKYLMEGLVHRTKAAERSVR